SQCAPTPGTRCLRTSTSYPAWVFSLTVGGAAMVFTQCSRPGADFPPLAGLAGSVFVAFLFEGADLRGDLRLGLPFAVTAIWPAVVPDSHRDAAMPFAVPAEVDARPAIRTPSSG